MKIYKKLALVVACLATSETMPAEKPAPESHDRNNETALVPYDRNDETQSKLSLAALELASMLPKITLSSYFPEVSEKDIKQEKENSDWIEKNVTVDLFDTIEIPKKLEDLTRALKILQDKKDIGLTHLSNKTDISLAIQKIIEEIKVKEKHIKSMQGASKIQSTFKKQKEKKQVNKKLKEIAEAKETIKNNVYYQEENNEIKLYKNNALEKTLAALNKLPKSSNILLSTRNGQKEKIFNTQDIYIALLPEEPVEDQGTVYQEPEDQSPVEGPKIDELD